MSRLPLKYQGKTYYINQPFRLKLVVDNALNTKNRATANTKNIPSCRRVENIDWFNTSLGRW